MVRMTDLLKKAKEQLAAKKKPPPLRREEERPPAARVEPEKAVPKKETPPLKKEAPLPKREEPIKREKPPVQKPVEFAEAYLGGTRQPPSSIPTGEEMEKLYFKAVETIKKIFNAYKNGAEIDREEIVNISNKIVNNIVLGSRAWLRLFHEIDSPEDFIYHNAVNVGMLSVAIGMTYRYNKSILLDLAIIGLLHDMDLIRSKHIIDMPKKLDKKEMGEIRNHPLNIATYVDNAFNFKEEMVNAILQHHERSDGKGYPAGLTEMDIHDFAAIVGIADTYEAMLHSRPYKEKMGGHKAVINIINSGKELFPKEVVKALVACVGLYPVGSWVELNTGEICKVLMPNSESPLRPVISILMDKDRNKFREVRTIDLQKVPSLYIKEALDKMSNLTKE